MRLTKEAAIGAVDLPEVGAGRTASASARPSRPDAQQWCRHWIELAGRGFGALSVLAVGAVHLQQYVWLYSAIPTIGTLFVLTFVGATVIGVALLTPIQRWAGRWGRAVLVLLTLGGIALAVVTFVLLLVSENMPLFGFQEPGYDPTAIAASQGAEVAAVIFLGVSLAARASIKSHTRRQQLPLTRRAEPHMDSINHTDKEPSA